ncbi:MAG: hypothetical protein GX050_09245 [Firmicutes bacterium]|nr:hypothetical protein [Bacillota bacterium]
MKTTRLFLLVVILFLVNAPCFAYLTPCNPGGFTLEISGGNNLFPLDVTLKKLKKELPMELDIPADFFYQNNYFLSLPLSQRETTFLGIFYRRAGFINATGETFQFYRCYANPHFQHENKYYDLAGDYLNYTSLGSYITKAWKLGVVHITLGGELFMCLDYDKMSIQGQGWVGGAKNYEIYGSYRREWSAPEDPWGWGLAVSSDLFYQQNAFSLHLNLQNLPAWLFSRS